MARSATLAALFQHPASTAQRHYEICRAYFLEQQPAEEVAERFQLRVASIRSLVRDFAQHPNLDQLFGRAPPTARPSPKRDAIRDRACELRRQGQTLEAIRSQLEAEGPDRLGGKYSNPASSGLAVEIGKEPNNTLKPFQLTH